VAIGASTNVNEQKERARTGSATEVNTTRNINTNNVTVCHSNPLFGFAQIRLQWKDTNPGTNDDGCCGPKLSASSLDKKVSNLLLENVLCDEVEVDVVLKYGNLWPCGFKKNRIRRYALRSTEITAN